ncbi:MAG: RidA family protein [Sphingomonadales bacterium]|nr:RidA family protein [Sphingomonadales bacterium]
MSDINFIDPGWQWDAEFPLSQGLRVGDVVILSGQCAIDGEGKVVGAGDLRAQTRKIFENIQEILDKAGASFTDIVKLTTFFTVDITDFEAVKGYFDVRREFFGAHKPASTGVQVTALVYPELMLEVEATAYLPRGRD